VRARWSRHSTSSPPARVRSRSEAHAFGTFDCLISGLDCLISGLDCLDCLISGLDCLDCVIYGLDCLIFRRWCARARSSRRSTPSPPAHDCLMCAIFLAVTVLYVPYYGRDCLICGCNCLMCAILYGRTVLYVPYYVCHKPETLTRWCARARSSRRSTSSPPYTQHPTYEPYTLHPTHKPYTIHVTPSPCTPNPTP